MSPTRVVSVEPSPNASPNVSANVPASVSQGPRLEPTDAEFWTRVLEAAVPNRRLRVLLEGTRARSATAERVVVGVSAGVLLSARGAAGEVRALTRIVAGREVDVVFEPEGGTPTAETTPTAPATPRTPIHEHPLVKQTIELFGARVLSVQARQK